VKPFHSASTEVDNGMVDFVDQEKDDPHNHRVLAVILARNDAQSLPLIHQRTQDAVPGADILIVEAGGHDGTPRAAEHLSHRPRTHVLHQPADQGLAQAYRQGYAWALDHGYYHVVQMRADGSHQPEEAHWLLASLAHADVALGSRWIPGAKVIHWPKSRCLLSQAGNRYAQHLLGLPISDASNGFRAFRTSSLHGLPLAHLGTRGHSFHVDVAYHAWLAEQRLVEVPTTFIRHPDSRSGTPWPSTVLDAVRVLSWGLRERRTRPALLPHLPTAPAVTLPVI
jgi:dolichol-phosphate mannosyltransferase